jgi:hypothetical protein
MSERSTTTLLRHWHRYCDIAETNRKDGTANKHEIAFRQSNIFILGGQVFDKAAHSSRVERASSTALPRVSAKRGGTALPT